MYCTTDRCWYRRATLPHLLQQHLDDQYHSVWPLLLPFSYPTDHFISSVFPFLKSSLSITLHRFYPFADKCQCSDQDKGKLKLWYKERDLVLFTVIEDNNDFNDTSGNYDHAASKIRPLAFELLTNLYNMSLLAIQVIVFPNKGFIINIRISHNACHNWSFMHFVRSQVATCM